jgi:hypothetical protein
MRELMVETAGAELAVRVSRPDGEALLLLHGGPGVPDSMQTDNASLIELGRAGAGGTLRLYLYGSLLFPPNPLRRWAMRHVMTETWHNYFLDPRTAPDPDREWLEGCCPEALLRTDRSLSRADGGQLLSLQDYTGPVLVLYGADDSSASRRPPSEAASPRPPSAGPGISTGSRTRPATRRPCGASTRPSLSRRSDRGGSRAAGPRRRRVRRAVCHVTLLTRD